VRLNLYIAVIVLQILKSNDQLLVARTTKRLGFVWSGTHTHTHTHTSARVCIYIYIYIYMCVCVRACVCVFVYSAAHEEQVLYSTSKFNKRL